MRPYKIALDTNAIADIAFANEMVRNGGSIDSHIEKAVAEARRLQEEFGAVFLGGARSVLQSLERSSEDRKKHFEEILALDDYLRASQGTIETMIPGIVEIELCRLFPELLIPKYIARPHVGACTSSEYAMQLFQRYPAVSLADAFVCAAAHEHGCDALITNDGDFHHDGFGNRNSGHSWALTRLRGPKTPMALVDQRSSLAKEGVGSWFDKKIRTFGRIERLIEAADGKLAAHLHVPIPLDDGIEFDCARDAIAVYTSDGVFEQVRVQQIVLGYGSYICDGINQRYIEEMVALWDEKLREEQWKKKGKPWVKLGKSGKKSSSYVLVSAQLIGEELSAKRKLQGPFVTHDAPSRDLLA